MLCDLRITIYETNNIIGIEVIAGHKMIGRVVQYKNIINDTYKMETTLEFHDKKYNSSFLNKSCIKHVYTHKKLSKKKMKKKFTKPQSYINFTMFS